MDIEERVHKLEESVAVVTEALRFRSEMDLRTDTEIIRLREDAEREHARMRSDVEKEHDRMRKERAQMYADHETRLRKLEHVAWATLGTASVSFVTALAAVLVKVWTG